MSKTFNFKKIIALLLVSIMAISVFFAVSTSFVSAYADYTTDRFDVNVEVQEDNTYLITETIMVDFDGYHHGIFRNIPENWGKMRIDNIAVSGVPFDAYEEDDNYVIQIGDPDATVTGIQKYTIKYRMRIFDDKDTAGDFFYLDVLPTFWETPIKASKISVNMPKNIDWDKVSVYAGKYGSANTVGDSTMDGDDVSYNVNESLNRLTITGRDLDKGVGITVRTDLPEGYWVNPMNNNWAKLPLILILIIVPVLCLLLWIKFGRDPKIVKTVEFYPPEGITPAELGYIIDGVIDDKDIVSLIVYFASKKYLSIKEYKKNKFELTKLCDIDQKEKSFAKTLFQGLFAKGDSVVLDNLDEDFGNTFLTARELLSHHFHYNKANRIFSSASKVARIIGCFLMIFPVAGGVLLSALYGLSYGYIFAVFPALIFMLAGMTMLMITVDKKDSMKKRTRTIVTILGMVFCVVTVLLAAGITGIMLGSVITAIGVVVSCCVSFFFTAMMQARTKRGAELQGKILGFKDFIRKAELEKLKLLVEEDPEYFYNVLPYAYVMGLSDKWAKNFEDIPMSAPEWYGGFNGNQMFNVILFSNMMNSCASNFSSNISFDAGDTGLGGGGGFGGGGGGFSGGGFGGGGGGAW
ncbi:MAG TPA: DUF2207 domain-containing protein [Anaerovoracaceae bacterium]|nr:DUF2207 domain-containing protein [Anaerovoracaceae bacterium]